MILPSDAALASIADRLGVEPYELVPVRSVRWRLEAGAIGATGGREATTGDLYRGIGQGADESTPPAIEDHPAHRAVNFPVQQVHRRC